MLAKTEKINNWWFDSLIGEEIIDYDASSPYPYVKTFNATVAGAHNIDVNASIEYMDPGAVAKAHVLAI